MSITRDSRRLQRNGRVTRVWVVRVSCWVRHAKASNRKYETQTQTHHKRHNTHGYWAQAMRRMDSSSSAGSVRHHATNPSRVIAPTPCTSTACSNAVAYWLIVSYSA